MSLITPIQKKIFDFIRHYYFRENIYPTEQEIAQASNLSSRGVVHRHLVKLAKAGLIRLTGRVRGIELLNPDRYMQLPITGLIACGKPVESLDEVNVLDLAGLIVGNHRFVLKVVGDSMSGDNICDGDYIICEKRDCVNPHEIAVVQVKNKETTLKRVKIVDDKTALLLPSNPHVLPMAYLLNEIKIQGVFLGLIRLTIDEISNMENAHNPVKYENTDKEENKVQS